MVSMVEFIRVSLILNRIQDVSGTTDRHFKKQVKVSVIILPEIEYLNHIVKIRFTSICSSEVALLCRNVTVALEDKLIPLFADRTFGEGIDQFVVVVIAVDADQEENAKFERKYNSVGRYKDIRTGENVRFMSIALPFNPDEVVAMTQSDLCSSLVAALLRRLKTPNLKIPKRFDYRTFVECIMESLENGNKSKF